MQVLDIDGDGRDGLLEVNWDNPNPFRFRLQDASGQIGPEIHFAMQPIRSYWAEDLDGDHKTEVMTIAMKSGRAAVSQFVRKPAEALAGAFKSGQFQVLPLLGTAPAVDAPAMVAIAVTAPAINHRLFMCSLCPPAEQTARSVAAN